MHQPSYLSVEAGCVEVATENVGRHHEPLHGMQQHGRQQPALRRALAEQQPNAANGQGDSPPENEEKGGVGSPPEQGGAEPPPETGQSPRPEEFHPQPDMTPEQAEALPAAVESLDREPRRPAAAGIIKTAEVLCATDTAHAERASVRCPASARS